MSCSGVGAVPVLLVTGKVDRGGVWAFFSFFCIFLFVFISYVLHV